MTCALAATFAARRELGTPSRDVAFDNLSDAEQQALTPHRPAEDEAREETLLYSAVEEAAENGHIPHDAINTVWKMLSGYSVAHAARTTGLPLASAFRHRRAAFEQLRNQIMDDHGETVAE